MFIQRSVGAVLALVASLSLNACNSSDGDGGTGPGTGEATVRFANGQADDPLILRANGTVLGGAVNYKQHSTACHTVSSGDVKFDLYTSGSSTPLVELGTTRLVKDRKYTVFAAGTNVAPMGIILPDSFGTAVAGQAKLRVLNATHSSFRFDIYVTGRGAPLGTVANKSDVSFLNSVIIDVPAGEGTVQLTSAGFRSVVGSSDFTLTAGQQLTIVITPQATVGAPFNFFSVAPCP